MSTPTKPQPVKPIYKQTISSDFPYSSKYIEIDDAKMHYIDEGQGDPILFLHGNPTSMYLWRNVMPFMEKHGRILAVDLVGFGKSTKPDSDYRFQDHTKYIDGFIETLGLKNITLVLHDWGSALGFHYAARHSENIKAISFMEAMVPPGLPFKSYEAMGRIEPVFRALRDPVTGPRMLIDQNFFIERMLPGSVMRTLSEKEKDVYRAPFLEEKHRKPILLWPSEIPIGGVPADTDAVMNAYSKWMQETDTPFLLLYASPGSLIPMSAIDWLTQNLKNIETTFVGGGLHYIQEDQPEFIGRAIADWYRRL